MKKLTIFLAFLLFVGFQAAAQMQISGTVTGAEDGLSIPGVSVVVKGNPTIGTTTDIDGKYSLTVPSSAEALVFSFVGMETVEELINGRTVIDVALATSSIGLDEIIVSGVAAGTPKKKMSISVSKVSAEDLQEVPATSAAQALQGKVAGVTVTQSSGDPGSAATIIIRGATQIAGSQAPLVIVDGVMVDGTLADINVDDIESYEVVKGASASALYGSRAGNGVIVITTKSGKTLKEGETVVRIRNEYGFTRLAKKYELAEHHEYDLASDWKDYDYTRYAGVTYPADYEGGWDAGLGGSRTPSADFYMDNPYAKMYDQQDELFTGNDFYTNYISVEGNLGKTNFMTSFENNFQGGIIDLVDGYKRQNFRININHRLTDKLSIAASNLYTKSTTKFPGGQNAYNGGIFFNLLLTQPDVDLNMENPDGQPYQFLPDPWMATTENPLYNVWKLENYEIRDRLISSFSATYAPFEWMNIDAKYAFEFQSTDYEENEPYDTYERGGSGFQYSEGSLYRYASRRMDETFQVTANLQKMFGDFTTKAKLSYLYEKRSMDWFDANGNNYVIDAEQVKAFDNILSENISADNYNTEERARNYFGIFSADYKGKYIVDAMIRRDGSSLFGEDNRWATYYRVSGAWRITEDFTIPQVQELKLRAAYGTAGQRPTYTAARNLWTGSGGQYTIYQLGNEELKPSRSTEFEVGLDAYFLNRFDFEAIYSNVVTSDQFLAAPLASHAGGYEYQWQNAGTLTSNTFEVTLGANVYKTKDLNIDINFMWDRTRSEITELNIAPYQTGPEGQEADKLFFIREGETFGTMYGYHFLTSLDEMEDQLGAGESIDDWEINSDGYVVPKGSQGTIYEIPQKELNADGTSKMVKIGDANPDFNLKFTTNVSWKNFQFYMLWDWKQGGDVYNKTAQWLTRDNRWSEMDQAGKAPIEKKTTTYYKAFYDINDMNDYWVEDGTYLKLREVSLYYTLKKKDLENLLGGFIKGVKVGFIARNVLTFTNYSGYDPEVQTSTSSGSQFFAYDFMGYPNFRSFAGSLELKF